jgi:type II secretion system (T2SS) protein E
VNFKLLPHFNTLRRAPTRYRKVLPLEVMKQYQCIIVGAASGTLTVAVSDRSKGEDIDALSKQTGRTIFPVVIPSARMRLLLQRIERDERSMGILWHSYYPKRFQVHGMVQCIFLCKKRAFRL